MKSGDGEYPNCLNWMNQKDYHVEEAFGPQSFMPTILLKASDQIDSYVESTKFIWTDSWSAGEHTNYFDKIWMWGVIHSMFIVDADSALQSTFRPILKLNYELVSCLSCSGRVASSTTSTTFPSCCQHRLIIIIGDSCTFITFTSWRSLAELGINLWGDLDSIVASLFENVWLSWQIVICKINPLLSNSEAATLSKVISKWMGYGDSITYLRNVMMVLGYWCQCERHTRSCLYYDFEFSQQDISTCQSHIRLEMPLPTLISRIQML